MAAPSAEETVQGKSSVVKETADGGNQADVAAEGGSPAEQQVDKDSADAEPHSSGANGGQENKAAENGGSAGIVKEPGNDSQHEKKERSAAKVEEKDSSKHERERKDREKGRSREKERHRDREKNRKDRHRDSDRKDSKREKEDKKERRRSVERDRDSSRKRRETPPAREKDREMSKRSHSDRKSSRHRSKSRERRRSRSRCVSVRSSQPSCEVIIRSLHSLLGQEALSKTCCVAAGTRGLVTDPGRETGRGGAAGVTAPALRTTITDMYLGSARKLPSKVHILGHAPLSPLMFLQCSYVCILVLQLSTCHAQGLKLVCASARSWLQHQLCRSLRFPAQQHHHLFRSTRE